MNTFEADRPRKCSQRGTSGDYTVLASPDNDTYTEVDGWALSSRVENGRLIHRFSGLAVTARYLKIHQRFTDTSYTFVLDDPRADVRVEFAARACDATMSGHHSGSLVVGQGVTCIDDASISGGVDVRDGAEVVITDSSVAGPVSVSGARSVAICGSRIAGAVTISGTVGLVQVGDVAQNCAGNAIAGGMSVTGGDVDRLAGNTINGRLSCGGNASVPIDGGVQNVVTGPRTGQCADL